MPSSDSTFYNLKRLHVVFALSSLALLAVTVWMVAADHGREWKVYQRTFRDQIEPWATRAMLQQLETDESAGRRDALAKAVEDARQAVPEKSSIERLCEEVRKDAAERGANPPDFATIKAAHEAFARQPSTEARETLLGLLRRHPAQSRLRQENTDRRLRFRKAEFDAARTTYEAGVGEGWPQARLDALQQKVDAIKRDVEGLAAAADQAAAHRDALAKCLADITRPEDNARQALADHLATQDRLERSLVQQEPSVGKRLLSLPFIDAFGRPLSVDQIWLPELTINYNFRRVARFDRCMTCHRGIDKTASASTVEPAYRGQESRKVLLPTPAMTPNLDGNVATDRLQTVYGFALAPCGLLDPQAVTVGRVLAHTAAAQADLLPGDVICRVGDKAISDRDELELALLVDVAWGTPLEVEIGRGLPHPYSSHPRLDLFVGSKSPHPASEFGCTVCHDGQGSATEFKFASHTPNHPDRRARWRREHGWFWNPDWDFAMRPSRFSQSNCLKCHHEVSALEASNRFPDPPAAKLVAGYHLIRQNGCCGCHEIKGVTGSGERIGPDMRLEANYHEASLALLATPDLKKEEQTLAQQVATQPENDPARRQLVASLQARWGKPGGSASASKGLKRAMFGLLATDSPNRGTMRKVGPSLRDMAGKLDAAFSHAWLAQPADFRPGTRMPQFFAMHEHLDGKGLDEARRFEPVEIQAMTEYLLAVSQTVPPLESPPGVTGAPSAERGKRLLKTQGCLACHIHADFPGGQSTQGPDLSRLGGKLTTTAGKRWLTSWIRNPARHSPRTLMPNPLLEPKPLAADEGAKPPEKADGDQAKSAAPAKPRMTDPAADIAEYLLGVSGWQPKPVPPLVDTDLDALAMEYLSKAYPATLAEKYLREGIPAAMADQAQGDAAELVGPMTRRKKSRYVGRRTIRKRGCFGCHDIPGFEDAQAIGPALSDWGRKQTSLLAFNQVHQFAIKSDDGGNADQAFYREALDAKRREGFLEQKLRAPRSFDYKKAENKSYNEQLLMGRFAFTDAEREAIITFVLGLVAEPPKQKYVYRPDRRTQAIVEGRKVLDEYGCARCHTLEMERWKIAIDPKSSATPPPVAEYPSLTSQPSPEQMATSLTADRRGLVHAELVGMPQCSAAGQLEQAEDEDGNPQYSFILWEPAVIAGKVWPVGGASVLVAPRQIVTRRPPLGGDFARLLYPAALAEAKSLGSTAGPLEAWGWVPPPLVRTGQQVQPGWLHDYLLDPSIIRPATVLRMPKYNLSLTEAAKLADYFAATAGTDFPFDSDPRGRAARLATSPTEAPKSWDNAFRVITDRKTFCAKCHLVGDYSPGGETRTGLAPNLEQVGIRIRPEYLRRWIANPKSLLPYTAMPVNFPVDQSLGQDLLPGASAEQLDAVVELLLNYDGYMKRRTSLRKMIESGGN